MQSLTPHFQDFHSDYVFHVPWQAIVLLGFTSYKMPRALAVQTNAWGTIFLSILIS